MNFDIDERKVRELVKKNGSAFNELDSMAVIDFISDMTDYLIDARTKSRANATGETSEEAENAVIEELEQTKEQT